MLQYLQRFKLTIAIVSVVIVAGMAFYGLTLPVSTGVQDSTVIVIKQGMSTKEISGLLSENNLIRSPVFFRIVARLNRLDSSLQAGEYSFSRNMSVAAIVGKLARGETTYRQITIPEGYTIDQIAALIESKKMGSAARFKAIAEGYAPYDYMNTAAMVKYKAEGFVFPDTYRVAAANISEEQLLKMMVDRFNDQFTPTMRKQAADLGLSVPQAVILASLVEREAQVPKDRPVIAGVFLKRLNLGMPLQSCATIQYILGYQKVGLTISDTEIPSAYNTYQNAGLPPGPIANPGLAAIRAVLNPENTDYLYFVADKNGAHRFSRTYEEHLAAIEQVGQ